MPDRGGGWGRYYADNVGQGSTEPGSFWRNLFALAQGNGVGRFRDEFDNDPDYRGGALGDSPAKVWQPEG